MLAALDGEALVESGHECRAEPVHEPGQTHDTFLRMPARKRQVLGVAEADVLAEIQAGNLKARQIGSQWRIAQAALDEFLRG